MHVQVRAKTTGGGGAFSDDGEPEDGSIAISDSYELGALSQMLGVLAEFNLRAASGHDIELGGEFSFWPDKRPDDVDHDAAAIAARDLLVKNGFDAVIYEVHRRHLADEPGALKAFVDEVTAAGLRVKEISVGTPDDEGVPVQIFTVNTPPAG